MTGVHSLHQRLSGEMSEEDTPKLYTDKPSKAQLKRQASFRQPKSAPSMSAGNGPPHKESLARRYKFIWPMLLAVNFSIGAYLLLMPKKKDGVTGKVEASSSTSVVNVDACIPPLAEK